MNWKVPKRPEYEKDEKGTEIEEIHFGRENQNENQIKTKRRHSKKEMKNPGLVVSLTQDTEGSLSKCFKE